MNHQPDQPWPPNERPVQVSRYDENDSQRQVRITRSDGTPITVACISQDEFVEALRQHRPDLDPDNPEHVNWIGDHPGQWRGV